MEYDYNSKVDILVVTLNNIISHFRFSENVILFQTYFKNKILIIYIFLPKQ